MSGTYVNIDGLKVNDTFVAGHVTWVIVGITHVALKTAKACVTLKRQRGTKLYYVPLRHSGCIKTSEIV